MADIKEHISVEQAVAKMINLDYIPDGFTVLDMTKAFLDDAKAKYDKAQFTGMPSDSIFRLKYQYKACKARHELAEALVIEFYSEFSTADDLGNDYITTIKDLGPVIYTENFNEWTQDRYGISIDSKLISVRNIESIPNHKQEEKLFWKDVTIKIYKDNYLGYLLEGGKYKRIKFSEIDCMGKRKNEPNQVGGLLIGLSQNKKFPKNASPSASEKTLISKLRSVLKDLTSIQDDPFYPFNVDQGWIPKFKLVDDRNNADNRAQQSAVHVPFHENRDGSYDEEGFFDDYDFEGEE